MQVEERLHQGGTKAAESKHRALRRHHLRPEAHRESQCVCERIPVCVCVVVPASLGVVTHTATVRWGGGVGWRRTGGGGGGGGSAAISVELIPQPVTGLSAAVIHTHAHTHTYEHWSH